MRYGLKAIAKQLTRNLNHIIDHNYYPTEEAKTSNLRHRPIGIGVQGLANVFFDFLVTVVKTRFSINLQTCIYASLYLSKFSCVPPFRFS